MLPLGFHTPPPSASALTLADPGAGTRHARQAQIDLRATAVAGLALITALIVAWLTEIARGHSGSPYYWLCAIGGLTYALAVAFFRWRG